MPEGAALPERWVRSALEPPRAFGAPLGRGRLRAEPEDFVVDEDLGFAPAGAGSHVLLKVRKQNANTDWVARELARAVRCKPFEVGYAGLKDRHAITTQWFSVPRPRAADIDLAALRGDGFEVLEAHAHTKKLPRGALAGNRFSIRVRDLDVSDAALAARLDDIARKGVPNYFGPQRFGRDAGNLRKISRDPRAIPAREQTYVLSAARSLVFNAVLAERVADATWGELEVGDVANLDGRGSVFSVDALDAALRERGERLDVHPTGPMWGSGALMCRGRIESLEQQVAANFDDACALVIAAGMRQERRSLRLAARDLQWTREGSDVVLSFWLMKGGFATTLLCELIESVDTELSD